MNTAKLIQTTGDAKQRQLQFQATVARTAGANRIEFHNDKGYAFSPGKSRPQIFRMA